MVDNDKYPNSLENLCSSDEYRFNRFKMIADGIQVNKKVSPAVSDFVQVSLQHLHVVRSYSVQIWSWVVDPHAGPGLGKLLRFTGIFEEPEKYLTAYICEISNHLFTNKMGFLNDESDVNVDESFLMMILWTLCQI